MSDYIDGEYETENLPALIGEGSVTVMRQPTIGIDLSTPDKLAAAVAQVENAMAYKDRVMELAIKTARPGAIIDQDGKPYFAESECERVLSMLGGGRVTIIGRPERYDETDGHYGYTASVEVSHPVLGTFQGWGSSHSTDGFLGTNKGQPSKKTGRVRDVSKVERHNLAQHALTRAKGAALRNMLGLKDLTWEGLKQWGFDPDKAGARVDRSAGRQSAPSNGKGEKSRLTRTGSKFYAVCKERWEKPPYAELSRYAAEQCDYTGDKILNAPDEVLAELLKAIEAGVIDGMLQQ